MAGQRAVDGDHVPDDPALRTERSRFSRWFGLLGGHVAWSAQLIVSYALVDEACPDYSTWYRTAVWAVTLGLAAMTAAALWASWRTYRRGAGAGEGEPARRERFLGLIGLFLNGIYLYAIALSGAFLVGLGRACT